MANDNINTRTTGQLVTHFSQPNNTTTTTTTVDHSRLSAGNHDQETLRASLSDGQQNNGSTTLTRHGSRRNSLRGFIDHVFAINKRTNCVFALILGANLIMSLLNTLLLSFIVKSAQLNSYGFFNGKLTSDRNHLTTILGLPGQLAVGKSILVKSIESHQDQSLFIKNVQSDYPAERSLISNDIIYDDGRGAEEVTQRRDSKPVITANGNLVDTVAREQQHQQQPPPPPEETLLISTGDHPALSGEHEHSPGDNTGLLRSNHMIVHTLGQVSGPDYGPNSEIIADHERVDVYQRKGARPGPPAVEFVTKSLVLNLINNNNNNDTNSLLTLATDSNQITSRHTIKQVAATTSSSSGKRISHSHDEQPVHSTTRRLLEFDEEQQSITLPLLAQFRAGPSGTAASGSPLIVDEHLNGGPAITGTIGDNLDLQARNADLNCRSGETLRLVSKSGHIRLISGHTLALSAPVINLSGSPHRTDKATSNGKLKSRGGGGGHLHLSDGLEYLDDDDSRGNEDETNLGDADNPLKAYNLVLVDGHLMASPE